MGRFIMTIIALDCESNGLDLRLGARPFLITICKDNGDLLYWEWEVDPLTRMPDIPEEDIVDIRVEIASADIIVGQNLKFDSTALEVSGILKEWPWDKTYDTLIAGHLLSSNTPHNLTDMGIQYLGRNIEKYEIAIKDATQKARRLVRSKLPEWRIAIRGLPEMPSATKEPWKNDMWLPKALCNYANTQMLDYDERDYKKRKDGTRVQPWWFEYGEENHPWQTVLSEYANKDSETTLLLWLEMEKELHRRGLWNIFLERMKVVPVAVAIERRGITLSGERLERLQCEFSGECDNCEKICKDIALTYGCELELPKGSSNNRSLTEFCFKPDNVLSRGVVEVCPGPQKEYIDLATGCLGLRPRKRGKPSDTYRLGTPSLDKDTLENYLTFLQEDSDSGKFVRALAAKRKRETALSYMRGYSRYWTELEEENNWYRIHPSLNPTGTDTLRWSSSNPNQQNLCVDSQTEFLTADGWIFAAELTEQHKVAQYWKDSATIDFISPKILVSHFKGNMLHLLTELHIDMLVTPNHRCLLRNRQTWKKLDVEAKDFKSDYHHFGAGNYIGGRDSLSQDWVIWLCAVQADGSYTKVKGKEYGIQFAFKKNRKIKRLRECLNRLCAKYTEKEMEDGVVQFYIGKDQEVVKFAKDVMPDKKLGKWLLDFDRETLDIFSEEFLFWDGSWTRKDEYTSSLKQNVDWAQIVWVLSGRVCNVSTRYINKHIGGVWHHYAHLRNRDYSLTTNFFTKDVPWDGPVYCVEVPSSYIVIRRNGRVSVTGNSKQEGFNLRYAFGPAPGREWWSLDAKNIELRIPAYVSGEKDLIYVFDHPNDPPYYGSYHLAVFDLLHPQLFAEYGKKCKEEFESTWYQWIKNGNFAVIYGAQESKADTTYRVQGAYEKIRYRFPKMAELSDKQVKIANRLGYVETIPDKSVDPLKGYPIVCSRTENGYVKPTVPLNYFVQSTAMWWTARAMVRTHTQLQEWNKKGFDGYITMQVHDELVLDFPKSPRHPKEQIGLFRQQGDTYWRIKAIKKLMEQGGTDIGVPIPVGVEYHLDNWSKGEVLS